MKANANIKKLVTAAIFAALTCVATMIINIPIPATNGYINVGDGVVILSAWLLGGIYGVAAAGIGSAMSDILLGYTTYAPGTFVIKALMALVAYAVAKALSSRAHGFIGRALSAVLAEAVMVLGYFVYEATLLGYGIGAVPGIFSNLIQAAGGVIISVAVMEIIRHNKFIERNSAV